MKVRNLIAVFAGAALLIPATGAFAQDPHDHSKDQATQDQTKPGMMGQSMMGMMQMMGMMGQMTAQNQDMSEMMKKLIQSMTAIQSEKDPAALKSKLAEHAALLDQMRSKMMQHGDMMRKMSGMIPAMMSGMMDSMMSGMMDAAKKADPAAKPQTAPDDADHSAHHPDGPAK